MGFFFGKLSHNGLGFCLDIFSCLIIDFVILWAWLILIVLATVWDCLGLIYIWF
jgi:hypothetical protein